VKPRIAPTRILKSFPARCKLLQRLNFRSSHPIHSPLWINFYYHLASRKSLTWFSTGFQMQSPW
jgi:hypothetical protein